MERKIIAVKSEKQSQCDSFVRSMVGLNIDTALTIALGVEEYTVSEIFSSFQNYIDSGALFGTFLTVKNPRGFNTDAPFSLSEMTDILRELKWSPSQIFKMINDNAPENTPLSEKFMAMQNAFDPEMDLQACYKQTISIMKDSNTPANDILIAMNQNEIPPYVQIIHMQNSGEYTNVELVQACQVAEYTPNIWGPQFYQSMKNTEAFNLENANAFVSLLVSAEVSTMDIMAAAYASGFPNNLDIMVHSLLLHGKTNLEIVQTLVNLQDNDDDPVFETHQIIKILRDSGWSLSPIYKLLVEAKVQDTKIDEALERLVNLKTRCQLKGRDPKVVMALLNDEFPKIVMQKREPGEQALNIINFVISMMRDLYFSKDEILKNLIGLYGAENIGNSWNELIIKQTKTEEYVHELMGKNNLHKVFDEKENHSIIDILHAIQSHPSKDDYSEYFSAETLFDVINAPNQTATIKEIILIKQFVLKSNSSDIFRELFERSWWNGDDGTGVVRAFLDAGYTPDQVIGFLCELYQADNGSLEKAHNCMFMSSAFDVATIRKAFDILGIKETEEQNNNLQKQGFIVI